MPRAIKNESSPDFSSVDGDEPAGAAAPEPTVAAEPQPPPLLAARDEVVDYQSTNWTALAPDAFAEPNKPQSKPDEVEGRAALAAKKNLFNRVAVHNEQSREHSAEETTTKKSYQKGDLQLSTEVTERRDGSASRKMSNSVGNSVETYESETPASNGKPHVADKPDAKKPSPAKAVAISGSVDFGHKHVSGSVSLTKPLEGATKLAGGIKAEGSISGPSAGFDATASAKIEHSEFTAEVEVKVNADLVDAKGKIRKEVLFEVEKRPFKAEIELDGEGKAGIDGTLKLAIHVGKNGVSIAADGDAFAGVKVSAGLGVTVSALDSQGKAESLFSARGQVSASAGASAGFNADFGLEGHQVKFKTRAQLTVGVGAGMAFSGKVDPLALGKVGIDVGGAAIENGDVLPAAEWLARSQLEGPVKLLELDAELGAKAVETADNWAQKIWES